MPSAPGVLHHPSCCCALLIRRIALGRTDSDVAKRVRTGDRLNIWKVLKAQEFEPFIPLVDWCLHPQPELRPTAAQALHMCEDLKCDMRI